MTGGDAVVRTLESAARTRRCVFFAGLSAVGKSLLVRELALLARARGRRIHLLQWDVARSAFQRPDILVRYPEVEGVTHAAIRRAVGLWVRAAVGRWDEGQPEPAGLLVGETPLIGNRFIELAQAHDDRPERLLASEATLFLIPVPSREVRRAIEVARARDSQSPAHEREAANAIPSLVSAHWLEIETVAWNLGLSSGASTAGYDPDLYGAVYRRLLRHRHAQLLPVDRIFSVTGSAYELGKVEGELVPTPEEVSELIDRVSRLPPGQLDASVERWYET